MSHVIIALLALAAGYVAGRTRPLRGARHRTWANVYLRRKPTKTQAYAFLALHPAVTTKAALGAVLRRLTGKNPFAKPPPEPIVVKLPPRSQNIHPGETP